MTDLLVHTTRKELYAYQIRDKKDRLITGRIKASNVHEAIRRLEKKALLIISVEKAREEAPLPSSRLNYANLMLLFRELSIMSRSGLPIQRSVGVLLSQTREPEIKRMLTGIEQSMTEGNSFTESLALYPHVFSRFHLGILRAAEEGGFLEQNIDYLSRVMERELTLIRKVKAAAMYPLFIFLVGIGGIALVFYLIFPFLDTLVREMGVKLPVYTQIMMNLAWAVRKLYVLIPFLVILFFIFRRLAQHMRNTTFGKFIVERLILSFPLVGNIILKAALTHSLIMLSALTSSGVRIISALELAAETCNNFTMESAFQQVALQVKDGKSIAESMGSYPHIFPRLLIAMVSIGEEAGELSSTLTKTAEIYELELSSLLESLTRLIEPLAIGVLGIIIGVVLLSFFIPIYSTLNTL